VGDSPPSLSSPFLFSFSAALSANNNRAVSNQPNATGAN
jgi:hypothetical protein